MINTPLSPLVATVHYYQDPTAGPVPDGLTVLPLHVATMPIAWLGKYRWLFDADPHGCLIIRAVNFTLTYALDGLVILDNHLHLTLRLVAATKPDPPDVPRGALDRPDQVAEILRQLAHKAHDDRDLVDAWSLLKDVWDAYAELLAASRAVHACLEDPTAAVAPGAASRWEAALADAQVGG